jgi:hypothetical protein
MITVHTRFTCATLSDMCNSQRTLKHIVLCEQVGRAGAEAAASTQKFAEGFEAYAANNLLSVVLKVHGEMRQVLINFHNLNFEVHVFAMQ